MPCSTKKQMNITINKERRLYVIGTGGGFSCFGFDNCYRDAVAMASQMNALRSVNNGLEYVAPTIDEIGTMACYEAYEHLASHFAKHPASKKTWFIPGTASRVKTILEDARKDAYCNANRASILRLFFGDTETGRDSCEENDTVGFIGRSTGTMKVPLLIEPLRSDRGDLSSADGGGQILTNCILRIIEVNTGIELYRHPKYQLPAFTVHVNEAAQAYPIEVGREGQTQARFPGHDEAGEYMAFLQGYRAVRPFRSVTEYNREMREAA
ncbi:conserved hypothetical protein (plasmid) [Rhodoferax ferrireducens T118]|uniref:Uncharacterized protein n=2 Tax=Rhodoferax ferrireducens TaxID=192843 RepID=Q21QD6_ALBFT|nr:conserved hypothetical protein [Rhodoferax ferrireducens T118]